MFSHNTLTMTKFSKNKGGGRMYGFSDSVTLHNVLRGWPVQWLLLPTIVMSVCLNNREVRLILSLTQHKKINI